MALPSNYKAKTNGSLQVLIATTLENLNTIPKVAGQMIYCSANNAVYYDTSASERMKVIDELVYWKQQPPAWVQRTSESITVMAELNVQGASYYWELSANYKGESTVWTSGGSGKSITFSEADTEPSGSRVARCKAIYNGKNYYSGIIRITSKNISSFGITDVYTKTETDAAITAAISAALTGSDTPIYSKDEVDALLEAKADTATTLEGYGITDAVSKDDFVFWEVQPAYVYRPVNGEVTLSAKLNVEGAQYQWEYTDISNVQDPDVVWQPSGQLGHNTNTMTVQVQVNDALTWRRCKAIYNGKTYYSNITRVSNSTLAGNGINDAYTKAQVDALIPDTSNLASKATTLAGYNIGDAYTKAEVDAAILAASIESSTMDETHTQLIQSLADDKADKATTLAGYGITDAYTKGQTDSAIATAVTNGTKNLATKSTTLSGYGITNAYTKAEVDALIPEVPDISGKADKATTLEGYGITDAVSADDFVFWAVQPADFYLPLVYEGMVYFNARLNVTGAVYQWERTDNLNPYDSSAVWVNCTGNGFDSTVLRYDSDSLDRTNTRNPWWRRCKAIYNGKTYYSTAARLVNITAPTLAGYGITDAYTKTEVDALIPDVSNLAAKSTTLAGYGITNAYTKSEVDAKIPNISNLASKSTTLAGYGITNAYTKAEVDALIPEVPDVSNFATKATTLAGYGITDAYTKTQTDTAITNATKNLASKSTTLAGYGITNAYTKGEVDALIPDISGKADSATTLAGYGITDAYTKTEVGTQITNATKNFATKSTTLAGYGIANAYTKTEVDALIPDISNLAPKATTLAGYGITNAYTKAETDSAISNAVANALTGDDTPVYSKDEVDALIPDISGLASKSTTLAGYGITNAYTKSEVDAKIPDVSNLATKSTTLSGYGITDAYTKTQTDTAITNATKNLAAKSTTLAGYGITNAYTKTEVDGLIPDVSNFATKATTLSGYGITDAYTKTEVGTQITNATKNLAAKATTLAGYGIADAYTKAEVDALIPDISDKADAATTLAGYGITDAYTKTEINAALSERARSSTTLSGYGITDAYTKTQADSAISTAIGKIKLVATYNSVTKGLRLSIA